MDKKALTHFEGKSLLGYFGVRSHQELLDFMKENPNNEDVQILNELLESVRGETDGK